MSDTDGESEQADDGDRDAFTALVVRSVLLDASVGERLTVTFEQAGDVTGTVAAVEQTDYPGEPRQTRVTIVGEHDGHEYDIRIDRDTDEPPTGQRFVFADEAVSLGRLDADVIDDPEEVVTLLDGAVTAVERHDDDTDGDEEAGAG